ncbi:hypothetical protein ACTXT7_003425 [Hymenolepis weldensis]
MDELKIRLSGSYEALNVGLIGDAMDDIIGGLTESYCLAPGEDQGMRPPPNLDDILIKAFDRRSLITSRTKELTNHSRCLRWRFPRFILGRELASRVLYSEKLEYWHPLYQLDLASAVDHSTHRTKGNPGSGFVLPQGFVPGQAFGLTDCRKLRLTDMAGSRLVRLVRLRNLWPSARVGWVGAWSEGSSEWLSLPPEDRIKVGLVKGEGEFWHRGIRAISVGSRPLKHNGLSWIDLSLSSNVSEERKADKETSPEINHFCKNPAAIGDLGVFYSIKAPPSMGIADIGTQDRWLIFESVSMDHRGPHLGSLVRNPILPATVISQTQLVRLAIPLPGCA